MENLEEITQETKVSREIKEVGSFKDFIKTNMHFPKAVNIFNASKSYKNLQVSTYADYKKNDAETLVLIGRGGCGRIIREFSKKHEAEKVFEMHMNTVSYLRHLYHSQLDIAKRHDMGIQEGDYNIIW